MFAEFPETDIVIFSDGNRKTMQEILNEVMDYYLTKCSDRDSYRLIEILLHGHNGFYNMTSEELIEDYYLHYVSIDSNLNFRIEKC